jgi:hypothetical protein
VTLQGSPLGVNFGASVGYMRLLMPNIQVGLRGNFGTAAANAFVAWNAMVWADYNLDEKLNDSIFIGLGAGVSGGPIVFNAAAEVGKRFELLHNLTWRPTLEVTHAFTATGNWIFNLNLINLSYLW